MKTPKYSVLMYCYDLTTQICEQIEEWVEKGIKVYLFTADSLDDIEKNPVWLDRRKRLFLQWFAVPYRTEYVEHTHYFIDGKVDDPKLFEFLVNHAEDQGFYSFNLEQFQVEHSNPAEHLFVIAGAGTGKTTAMIQRILFLKHTLADFSFTGTAMITFTNEAALLMRNRLQARIKDYYELTHNRMYLNWLNELEQLHISTFHSFAKAFLEREGRTLGLSSNMKLRNYVEKRRMLIEKWIDHFAINNEETYRAFQRVPHYLLVQAITMIIHQLENHSLHSLQYDQVDFGLDQSQFHAVLQAVVPTTMKELEQVKQETNEWEVNDLIRKLYEIQENTTAINLETTYHTVFVDEFQDTDLMQVKFVQWLERYTKCRLLVVGDVKQSIYRFRGADYTAFDQMRKGLSQNINYVYLTKNYRSSKQLIHKLEPYFQHWGSRLKAFPYTKRDSLRPMNDIKNSGWFRYKTELGLIKYLLEKEGKDAAILVRTNREVQEIIDFCEDRGVFCTGPTQGNFFRTRAVRELYQLIRFLIYPQSASACYAIHQSSYGEQTLHIGNLIEQSALDKQVFHKIWKEQPDYKYWISCVELSKKIPLVALLEKIIADRNPAYRYANRQFQRRMKLEQDEENVQSICLSQMTYYQNQLEQLMFLIKRQFSDTMCTLLGLEHYLRISISTNTVENEPPMPVTERMLKQPIVCMTVHQAKGQEFDHVIIPHMDNLFYTRSRPHVFLEIRDDDLKMAYRLNLNEWEIRNNHYACFYQEERGELVAEETRLLYVAMTRAKKTLLTSIPKSCRNNHPNSWGELIGWGELHHV